MISPSTPVIIGVGQAADRLDAADYHAWSAPDLAAVAARAAIEDAQAKGSLVRAIDAIGTTRTFEDVRPGPAAFGKSSNFPRSVAARLGITPEYALWTKGGGNSPQDLVCEFCERIAEGEFQAVLIAGAEAISTVRHALSTGRTLNFAEVPDGSVDDRGSGLADFTDPIGRAHGILSAPLGYALAETARRGRRGESREAYARSMGKLFAPLAAVAHANNRSAWSVPAYTPDELIEVSTRNRWIADPYPLNLVARDQVNLGAAIVIASRRTAEALGVPTSRMIYLHGYASAVEKPLLRRPDMGSSPAARLAARTTVANAGVKIANIAAFDFYSCFPIAVSNVACDEFGLTADDPRKLTVTGGLPFFGGPGNNYSMHAIAEMVERLRGVAPQHGFVGANGGLLSKYSAAVYSNQPREFQKFDAAVLQANLDAIEPFRLDTAYSGEAVLETCTVHHQKGRPQYAIATARIHDGARIVAKSAPNDSITPDRVHNSDLIGAAIMAITGEDKTTTFSLAS